MIRAAVVASVALAGAVQVAAQTPRIELRSVGYGVLSKRSTALDATTVGAASGMMKGGQVSLRTQWFGVAVDLMSGELSESGSSPGGGGKLTTGEARIQVGPRVLALEGGYARRASGGALATTVYSYVRAGASSILDIGGTGLSARLSAGVYLAGQGVSGATVSGHEVVTALEYQVRRIPVVVTVGYRAELFQTAASGRSQPESVTGVILGGGLRLRR